jgi:sugar phosphate isomerase/epimerase
MCDWEIRGFLPARKRIISFSWKGWDRGLFERKRMLGISTSWKSEMSNSGIEIIEAILDLPVEGVELEYRITTPMLKEILPLLKKRRFSVVSLHNFFPLPEGLPKEEASGDVFSLSAPDREERERAVKYTLRTMEWAEEFGAKAVVLHLGKIPMDDPMEDLKKLYDQRKIQTQEGEIFIEEQKRIRAQKSAKHLDAALRSLERLAPEAERRRVLLGVENRVNIQDFPDFGECKILFREFFGGPVRYWHDIGHATAQQNLGLTVQKEFLENFAEVLVGVHLHGCQGYDDHRAPGSGEEDYSLMQKFLKADTLRVVETHHRASREELLQGLEFLRALGIS